MVQQNGTTFLLALCEGMPAAPAGMNHNVLRSVATRRPALQHNALWCNMPLCVATGNGCAAGAAGKKPGGGLILTYYLNPTTLRWSEASHTSTVYLLGRFRVLERDDLSRYDL